MSARRTSGARCEVTVTERTTRVVAWIGPFTGRQRRGRVSASIKTRQRVRELAEDYIPYREVDAMLDLVCGMFPSDADPSNTDRTFLEQLAAVATSWKRSFSESSPT